MKKLYVPEEVIEGTVMEPVADQQALMIEILSNDMDTQTLSEVPEMDADIATETQLSINSF